jgi:competence protein ComEC
MRKLVTGWRLILALVFLVAVAWAALRGLPDGRLHVWFLDVGQGDAVLIQTPDGTQVLVDGGPSPSALFGQLGEVLPFWDRSLDLVVLTHPDSDHMAGLIPLLERYRVTTVVDSVAANEPGANAWLAAVGEAGVARQVAARGMELRAGSALMTVLHPAADPALIDAGNDDSIVLRLQYGATSALFTGDAEAGAEGAMVSSLPLLKADVLKVAHHGSASGTSARFVAAVAPQLAVISVGAENRFGHPAPEVLDRLRGAKVLRTDQRGRIELESDGMGWIVRSER